MLFMIPSLDCLGAAQRAAPWMSTPSGGFHLQLCERTGHQYRVDPRNTVKRVAAMKTPIHSDTNASRPPKLAVHSAYDPIGTNWRAEMNKPWIRLGFVVGVPAILVGGASTIADPTAPAPGIAFVRRRPGLS
jgi:hypothetical protein